MDGLVIKLDLGQAFDKVDWDFLNSMLKNKGFGQKWMKWIHACISTTNFSININGKPRGKIKSSRGQARRPLSSFLFIIVMDCLSRLNCQGEKRGLITGYTTTNASLSMSHLQFAVDTLLFF